MGYYDEIAAGYDLLHKQEQLRKLDIVRSNLEIRPGEKLLDVGCGTGFSLDFFDCNCVGIEPGKKMAGIREDVIVGLAEDLPFDEGSFDIVISITAIHNFKDIKRGLAEMNRVGKDRFAFSVLNRSAKFKQIREAIEQSFDVEKTINEGTDTIFIAKKLKTRESSEIR